MMIRKRTISFGIIGCGLMGREFGSAVARWCHLLDQDTTSRIAQAANARIMPAMLAHLAVLVGGSSEFPSIPAGQQILQFMREERFGTILEVQDGFLHSSHMDPRKPINWKRRVATNGEYG